MADSITYTPPADEAESVRQALQREHAEKLRRGPKVAMPGGVRIDARPYINMRYQGADATTLLARPETILLEPHVGSKYIWKKRNDRQTAAWVRAGVIRPITTDEIDQTNPLAEYVENVTPGATYVAWESLGLFEMGEKWVRRHYIAPEEWAIARLAQQTQNFESTVEERTRGAYTGKFTIKDRANK